MSTETTNQQLNDRAIFTHSKVTDMDNRPIINGDLGVGEQSTGEGLVN